LKETLKCLEAFLDPNLSPDMACEELRTAVENVGAITGNIDVEDVLDVLFRDFCIGK
jgi:tRNA modification GTPase